MLTSIEISGQTFAFDHSEPINISIPLDFNGTQPNAYDVERATSNPCRAGEIIGDTRQGGSVNFEQYKFIPHCNGTHTECVGHITWKRIAVNNCLQQSFMLANLISVLPQKASETKENYAVEINDDDLLITRKALKDSGLKIQDSKFSSLIIRTLPNDEDKLSKTYLKEIPPYFSNEAMDFINEIGVEHLLVDMPSIDRIFDEGKLSNHRHFWNVEQGSFEITEESFINRTITELIYVPNEIKDGGYLLNLQIAPFQTDASPSRPILYKLIERS